MSLILRGAVLWLGITCLGAASVPDYEPMTHDLQVRSLRSGNQDADGTNEYFFTVELFGLVNSIEENGKKLDERKKVVQKIGETNEIRIKTLSFWKSSDASIKGVTLTGDQIRVMVSKVMQQFSVLEKEVEIVVRVAMFERSKKYYILNQDDLVAEASYRPLSVVRPESGKEPVDLELSDGKETFAAVGFEVPAINEKRRLEEKAAKVKAAAPPAKKESNGDD